MWNTVLPSDVLLNISDKWEPIELRMLKRKLANVTCKCQICRHQTSTISLQESEDSKSLEYTTEDTLFPLEVTDDDNIMKDVDVEEKCASRSDYDVSTQMSDQKIPESLQVSCPNIIRKDLVCPNCFNTVHLFRDVLIKNVKDEEITTRDNEFTCEKATSKTITCLEKTTSFTTKSVLLDLIEEVISEESLSSTFFPSPDRAEETFGYKDNYYMNESMNPFFELKPKLEQQTKAVIKDSPLASYCIYRDPLIYMNDPPTGNKLMKKV